MPAALHICAISIEYLRRGFKASRMPAPPSIALLPLPNFTLMSFALFVDVLRLAADEGDRSRPIRHRWTVIAPTLEPIKASNGMEFRPWELLGDPTRFDYIVVCGGLLRRRHDQDDEIEVWLRRADAAGVTILGLCTGVFTLAQAGLLEGHKVCVSWYHVHEFHDEFPETHVVATELFVVDRERVTCAGGRGAADMAAWIVERHAGAAVARKALDILLIGPPRPGDQLQPRPPVADGVRNESVRRAILLMEERRDRPLPIPVLARAVGLSRRQLERLFVEETGKSPAAFAAQLRVQYADWLVETTEKTLTEIALDCGYSDLAHFSRSYKLHFMKTPSVARQQDIIYMARERRPFLASLPGSASNEIDQNRDR
jgi:transcriptional regulator GlxA family with amidase domain